MSDTIALDRAYLPADPAAAAPPIPLAGFREGVVFGLGEDDYHAVPALSYSGIKHLLVSPMDFWARSWMSPVREDEDSEAKFIGRAYDKRIVEGLSAFDATYAVELDRADYPDALVTADDIKAELKKRGEKLSGLKADLIERLLRVDPEAQVWDRLVDAHANRHADRILIRKSLRLRIEIAARMIEGHPELCRAFRGGVPQVSIFWHDRETGVPMKARIDYLKPRAVVDLKTLTLPDGMSIERAIYNEIARRKYFIQAGIYQDAVAQIGALAARGLVRGTPPAGFVDAVARADDRQSLYVFQIKGIAPVARGVILPRTLMFDVGMSMARDAMRRFADCLARFMPGEPWIEVAAIETLDDAGFPAWAAEL